MEIGIIGLPGSGKTTVFNALTRGRADVASYGGKPNVGVAAVPDTRLDRLAALYDPRRPVPAMVSYVDIPPPATPSGRTRGISGQYLNDLQRVDALLIVARGFNDEAVLHVDGSVDPFRDVENMMLELLFSDLELLERRLQRLDEGSKGAKAAERDAIEKERDLLGRIKGQLEVETPIRDQQFTPDQADRLRGFQFLTSKPLIVLLNIDEDDLDEARSLEERLTGALQGPSVRAAAICGKLEMDLAQMDAAEEAEFREAIGAGESGMNRIIRLSYDVVGLITFLTIGDDEVRTWELQKGTAASRAAGKIHTDFEQGFIRAEVVPFDELVACGGFAEARKRGVLRQEGKEYVVQDGDVMHVLFNL